MNRVIVDASTGLELRKAGVVAEICDPAGKVIGYFRPSQVPQHLLDIADVPIDALLERGRLRIGRPLSAVISDCEAGNGGQG
jgi:hypothetical protein